MKLFKRIFAFCFIFMMLAGILPQQQAEALKITEGVICASNVALRAKADKDSKVLMRLDQGTVVEIKSTNVNAEWYRVTYKGKTGYVNRVYIDWDSDYYDLDYVATVANVKEFANVRSQPTTNSKVLGEVEKGEELTIVNANVANGWHQVSYKKQKGYIRSKYVDLVVDASDKQLNALSVSGGNMRPAFSPNEAGYLVTTNKSKVTIKAEANKGVTVKMNGKKTNKLTVDIAAGGMKSVRISVGNKISYTVYIMRDVIAVGTWNIKRGNGHLLEQGRLIRDQMPDIMGLQEVFIRETSGNITNNLLSLKTKHMSKTAFTPTVVSGASEYGHGVLSTYSILSHNIYKLSSPGVEQRCLSKTVLNVEGKKVSFYNAHLSYNSKKIRATQFEEIAEIMKKDKNKYKILVGDFNASYSEFSKLAGYRIVNTPSTKYYDYYKKEININQIDNILLSKNIKLVNTRIIPNKYSDHAPVFAYIILK